MKNLITTNDIRTILESYGIRCYDCKVRHWIRSNFNREKCRYDITEEMVYEFVYRTLSSGIAFEKWVKSDERVKHLIRDIYHLNQQVDELEKRILQLDDRQTIHPFI